MGNLAGIYSKVSEQTLLHFCFTRARFFFSDTQRMDKESEKILCLQAWDQTSNTMDYKSG